MTKITLVLAPSCVRTHTHLSMFCLSRFLTEFRVGKNKNKCPSDLVSAILPLQSFLCQQYAKVLYRHRHGQLKQIDIIRPLQHTGIPYRTLKLRGKTKWIKRKRTRPPFTLLTILSFIPVKVYDMHTVSLQIYTEFQ